MASSINQTTILWSSASTISLSTNSRYNSDTVTLNVEDWDGSLQVTADNSGTPTSGDVVDVYVKWTNDGTLFDTDEHAEFVCRLDTFPTNTPGEDPVTRTYSLDVSGKKGFKVSAVAAQGATRAITFSATLVTHRPQ